MKARASTVAAPVQVDEHQVGVAAGRDGALLGIQAKDPGRVRAGHLDQPLRRQAAADDSLRDEEREHGLYRRGAERNVVEDVQPATLLDGQRVGRMVAADDRQLTAVDRVPEVRAVGGGAERRRDLRQRAVRLHRTGVQDEVLRTGLAHNRVTGRASLADPARGRLARHVHDVERDTGDAAEADRPERRLLLEDHRAAPRERRRGGVARGSQARLQVVRHRAVLGVHHRQTADLADPLHEGDDQVVGNHPAEPRQREEHLERAGAALDARGDLVDGLPPRPERDVEPDVDERDARHLVDEVVEDPGEAVGLAGTAARDEVGDDRGDASCQRRLAERREVVRVVAERVEVAVPVHQSGEHQLALGGDDERGVDRRAGLDDIDDPAVAHEHVGPFRALGRHHGPASDREIDACRHGAHRSPSRRP